MSSRGLVWVLPRLEAQGRRNHNKCHPRPNRTKQLRATARGPSKARFVCQCMCHSCHSQTQRNERQLPGHRPSRLHVQWNPRHLCRHQLLHSVAVERWMVLWFLPSRSRAPSVCCRDGWMLGDRQWHFTPFSSTTPSSGLLNEQSVLSLKAKLRQMATVHAIQGGVHHRESECEQRMLQSTMKQQ